MHNTMINIIIDAVMIISISGFSSTIYDIIKNIKKHKNDINEINNAIKELDEAYNYYYHKRNRNIPCVICSNNRRRNCNNYSCPYKKSIDDYNAYSELLKDIATARDKLHNIVVDI